MKGSTAKWRMLGQLTVEHERRGLRADRWLAERLSSNGDATSRTEVGRWFELGLVQVGGLMCSPSRKMRSGELVTFERPEPVRSEATSSSTCTV